MNKVATTILMSMILLIGFSSCSKDEESSTLKGTSWKFTSGNESITIRYTNDVDCIYTYVYDNGIYSESTTSRYTYMYEAPYVEMYPEDEDNAVLRGLINGEIMEVTNKSNNKNIGTFYKF